MKIDTSITKSADFGRLKFSIREDYINYFIDKKIVTSDEELWSNEGYVSAIHRHWHSEGRNGCIFALLAARRAEDVGWEDFVISESFSQINDKTRTVLRNAIVNAIENEECQILSLLFSQIVTVSDLVKLIKWLINNIDVLSLVNEEQVEEWVNLQLRIPVNSSGALSWLMAFGPFDFFPKTRQSPITEIAIRVKEKPDKIYYRLNNDKESAHLADLPLDYKESVMDQTWLNTLKRTRYILGEEPNEFSAAKTTFTVPRKIWFEDQ